MPPPGGAAGRFDAALAVTIGVLAAWLRLRFAGAHQPWQDEVALWLQSVAAYGNSADPPLGIALTRLLLRLHGDWDAMHWAPAVLGGLACVPVWWLSRALGGERGLALFAAAVYAVSPQSVLLSAQARPYGLLMFFEALALCAFARALARDRWQEWTLFTLLGLAMVNVHLLGLVVIAGLAAGVGLAWTWGAPAPSLRTLSGLAVASIAALVSLPRSLLGSHPGHGLKGLAERPLAWLGESLASWAVPVSAATPDWPSAAFSLALLGAGAVCALRRRQRLLVCLAATASLAQLVTALTIGSRARWTMTERYVSHGLVPFVVLASWLLLSRAVTGWAPLRRGIALGWLVGSVCLLPELFTRPSPNDAEQRGLVAAHRLLAALSPRPDGLVLDGHRSAAHFRLLGESPVTVWVTEDRQVRRVRFTSGIAGPPAVPQLEAAQPAPGNYLLVGRGSFPAVGCQELSNRLGMRGAGAWAAVGELCRLEKAPQG